jgi:acyl-CoA synthetase (NDP forming)
VKGLVTFNFMHKEKNINWEKLFSPTSIAVIGASNTPGSWGFTITRELLAAGSRRIYPVNPKSAEILQTKSYASILDVPDSVDLAVIVVSPQLTPEILRDCASKGVKMALIVTSGFAETGEPGRKLEADLIKIASQNGIHFVGPNSMGHAVTAKRLSTFGQGLPSNSGSVAVLSQSGSMTLTVVRQAASSGIGFSKYISTGNEADLHLEDYLDYLAKDGDTRIIAAYIEGLREGRRFFNLAREITTSKPIVTVKVGGTGESAKAVMSHTGALAGSDAVYSAAFRQSGVIRVENDEELCDVLFALVNCPLPKSNRIGILSIGGGPGAMTAEACEKEGLTIVQLGSHTINRLDSSLPSRWSHRNPVDMAGINAAEYPIVATSLWALMEDDNIDVIFLLAPIVAAEFQLTDRLGLHAGEVKEYREKEKANLRLMRQKIEESGKPVILLGQARGIMNDPHIASVFADERIPVYSNARRAARVVRHLSWYRAYLDSVKGK